MMFESAKRMTGNSPAVQSLCQNRGSGSDRIIKFRGIVRVPSLPLRVLTRVLTHSLNAWARESLASQKARSLPLSIIRADAYLSSFDRRFDVQIFHLSLNQNAAP